MIARAAWPGRRLAVLVAAAAALVPAEARRPASWLAAGGMLAVVVLTPPPRSWVAAAAGALLGLASIGVLRRGSPPAELLAARLGARVIWPLAAAAAGGAVAGLAEGAARLAVAVVAACGVVVATAAVAAAPRPLDRRLLGERPEPGAAGDWTPRLVGRSWADAVAMVATLVAMAVCYFLAPEYAGWYAAVATTWFTLLAVPAAMLAGGDAALQHALAAAGPGRPRLPGAAAAALPTLTAYAAVLGWPAAVAAAVARDRAGGWSDPRVAVGVLAGMAAAAAGLAWLAAKCRWRDDTAHAAFVAAHAAALALTARVA